MSWLKKKKKKSMKWKRLTLCAREVILTIQTFESYSESIINKNKFKKYIYLKKEKSKI